MSAAIGGYGRMTQLNYLDAGRYSGIKDRSVDLEAVRRELQVIIDGELPFLSQVLMERTGNIY